MTKIETSFELKIAYNDLKFLKYKYNNPILRIFSFCENT